MAAFIASYAGPTGQPRTVTIKAANLAEAKKLRRRRGFAPKSCGPSAQETPRTATLTGPTRQVSNQSTSTACLRKRRA